MGATSAMLDGVKEACEAWGRAMRWVLGSNGEGYPTLATFERARGGELDAKAIANIRQRFGEVMAGDALAVRLAIRKEPAMPEELHRLIFMHYVVPHKDCNRGRITIKRKAFELGYLDSHGEGDSREYYAELENAHHFLAGRLPIDRTFHEEPYVRAVCA